MPAVRIKFISKSLHGLPLSSTNSPNKYKDEGAPQSRKDLYLHSGRTAKVFYFVRKINGRTIRHRIGEFPATTIEKARKRCAELAANADKGINPVDEKRKARQRGLAFGDAYQQYIENASSRAVKPIGEGTRANYKRAIELHFSKWVNKPCSEILYEDVRKWYSKTVSTYASNGKTASSATAAMRLGRAVIGHQVAIARRQGSTLFLTNPFVGHALVKEQPRTNCIESSELPEWFNAVFKLQNDTTRDYLLVLLFTGLRRREAAMLTWSDINLRKKTLTAKDTKNGTDHTLPLSTYMTQLLIRRKIDSVSPWVFPGTGTKGPIAEPKKAIISIANKTGIHCAPHGLRRTFSNIAMNNARVPEPVRKLLLNHRPSRDDVTAFHYTSLTLEQLRPHMQTITDTILDSGNQDHPTADVIKLEAAL